MKYYDDITTMHGDEAEAVDVIIGGSPCQDLSVAGQRAGLDGERSSLFLDQIRVIKEAHSKYGRNKPRYMVWENVPGALSSAGGEDFRRVLEETAKVADETAVIPRPEKGKWTTAGAVVGDGYSIAWRILDAQFWGVPQRRRRIALVADFGGESAPETLFERKSLSGHTAESGTAWQGTAGSAESGTRETGGGADRLTLRVVVYNNETITSRTNASNPQWGDPCHTLGATGSGRTICIQGNCIDRADTAGCNGRGWRDDDVSYTLNTIDRPAVCIGNGQADSLKLSEMVGALNCMHDQQAVVIHGAIRRLTPLECERLQGYPDGWTDIGEWTDSKGKVHKTTDSARYKALGNSIALPPWRFVCRRICEQYDTPPTMGSLFDGIGGFPLIWREINGDNSVPWACEIDEYCRAVTQRRLP